MKGKGIPQLSPATFKVEVFPVGVSRLTTSFPSMLVPWVGPTRRDPVSAIVAWAGMMLDTHGDHLSPLDRFILRGQLVAELRHIARSGDAVVVQSWRSRQDMTIE